MNASWMESQSAESDFVVAASTAAPDDGTVESSKEGTFTLFDPIRYQHLLLLLHQRDGSERKSVERFPNRT